MTFVAKPVISFPSVVLMMKANFITGNYSRQTGISDFLTAL
jgi:hypothetical protein